MPNTTGNGKGMGEGAHIERLRLTLNLNQSDFGRHLGVTPMTVSRWERGINDAPTGALIAMAKLATTKADCWLFLGMAGFSRVELAGAVRNKK